MKEKRYSHAFRRAAIYCVNLRLIELISRLQQTLVRQDIKKLPIYNH